MFAECSGKDGLFGASLDRSFLVQAVRLPCRKNGWPTLPNQHSPCWSRPGR